MFQSKNFFIKDKSGLPILPAVPDPDCSQSKKSLLDEKNLLENELQALKLRLANLENKLEEKDDVISKLECAKIVADKLNKELNSERLRWKEEKDSILRQNKIELKA